MRGLEVQGKGEAGKGVRVHVDAREKWRRGRVGERVGERYR